MSLRRKLSFRSKSRTESFDESASKNGFVVKMSVKNVYSDEVIEEKVTSSLIEREIHSLEDNIESSVVIAERSEQINTQSFPIPDGLAMDPLAPTAIAVSSNFMERIGNGLSLLKDHGRKVQKYMWKNRKVDVLKKSWKSLVNVVLVDAKDLPDVPPGGSGGLYCKFKLGTESHKSKQVSKAKASWCERFNLYLYEDSSLEITVWHKGKSKVFMGRCTIDVSQLEKEKTHELWQELGCGYGALHLLITISGAAARNMVVDSVPTTNGLHHEVPPKDDYSWYKLNNCWDEVGQLSVTVHGAKGLSALGLSGKADAYAVLELDNSRVQTHTVLNSTDPNWSKTYTFPIHDITSTLFIKVFDESKINLMTECLGKVCIPLLRINNDESKWYALKSNLKKSSAKGNCPRIQLQMSVVWNPIKASFRILSPKEVKFTQKQPKFDIPLIYSNAKVVKDVFHTLYLANEIYKSSFEWENKELSFVALVAWVAFWSVFRLWMFPLLFLIPFIYFWTTHRNCHNNILAQITQSEDELSEDEIDTNKDEQTIKTRLYGLQDVTITIKNGIDYLVSLLERLRNLSNFTVPYLSYLAMIALVGMAAAFYFIPANYIFMAIGIYKFSRKFLYPERIPNNDVLDFLSRVPNDEILKEWRELKVPEPDLSLSSSLLRR